MTSSGLLRQAHIVHLCRQNTHKIIINTYNNNNIFNKKEVQYPYVTKEREENSKQESPRQPRQSTEVGVSQTCVGKGLQSLPRELLLINSCSVWKAALHSSSCFHLVKTLLCEKECWPGFHSSTAKSSILKVRLQCREGSSNPK